MCLLNDAREHIVNDCGSLVVTATGMKSPQGIIVSRVARDLGMKSIVFVGCTSLEKIKENPKKYTLMANILNVGGEINADCKAAFDVVLQPFIDNWSVENKLNPFRIRFGINMSEYRDAILGSVANQVQNLPDNLDYLIVPCGSCIMLSGILLGLEKFNKKVGKVVGIQISGFDKRDFVNNAIGHDLPYDFRISKDFKYATPCKKFYNGLELDWLYEGKAFDYMEKYMLDEIRGKNVCFWLVGNSTPVRTGVY
jgi:1-aminocyclopropane-1-carboxylate deaminase/D-cysteine desulfhydrase-like pyridoxal-dependent ACC family enzyme